MSTKYPGGIISKTAPTPSGPYSTDTAPGIWTLEQQAYWQKLGQWPTAGNYPKDAQFNYVTMLLHGDGTNGAQNNTFLDSSTNNFTITRNGNTTQGSFSPYGSNWSNTFNLVSTPDYLSVASNAAFGMGTGDYTIESWFYCTDTGGYQAIVDCRSATPATGQILFRIYASGQFYFSIQGTGNVLVSPANIALNTWVHAAVVKASGVYTLYINGTSVATASNSVSIPTSPVTIGWDQQSGNGFQGYISNVRIVKGTAVYTGNFTPSTTPLTAVSGTSLLTCQSNRFVDNSSNAFAITVNNAPSVQRFNPFGASTAYSTSVIGGSGYFDGSGDYLTIGNPAVNSALDFGAGDFTIEAWVRPNSTGPMVVVGSLDNSSGNGSWWFVINGTFGGGSTLQFGYNVTAGGSGIGVLRGTGTLPVNTWNHVAVTRSGSNIRMYLNGSQLGSTYTGIGSDTIYPVNQNFLVGETVAGPSYGMNGYISDVRLLKGTALYTGSTYTIPTAPLTAITNTSRLLNFTNGAIFDNAMMNDLETVGNAQISTSVVKYGTGSMYFDETGDYIKVPPSTNMSLGTGDFTIECWVRFAANPVGNGQGVYQLTNGYLNNTIRGPACGVENSTGGWTIYYGTTYTISGTVPTTGVWYHTAYVRSSGTTKLYIDGTSIISVADTTNYTDQYFTIGGWYDVAFLLNGYIDDLRITKGYARYTTNFTPPTAAFPDIGPT